MIASITDVETMLSSISENQLYVYAKNKCKCFIVTVCVHYLHTSICNMNTEENATVHATKSNLTHYNIGKEAKVAKIYKTDLEGHTEEFQTNMERPTRKPVCIDLFSAVFYSPTNWFQERCESVTIQYFCWVLLLFCSKKKLTKTKHTSVEATASAFWDEIEFA